MLLEHGADPDATGPRDQTALMWAVADRHSDVVGVLVRHGADVHARSAEWKQLKAHAPHPHPENQIWVTQGGNTALMFAARVGDLTSARYLVAAGADVNDTDGWGISALTMAAYSNFGAVFIEPAFDPGGPFQVGGKRTGQFAGLVGFLTRARCRPEPGSREVYGATRCNHAPGRRHGGPAPRTRGRSKHSARDVHSHPTLVYLELLFPSCMGSSHPVLACCSVWNPSNPPQFGGTWRGSAGRASRSVLCGRRNRRRRHIR